MNKLNLNQLVKDLKEIKDCMEDNYIEKAEDLLDFVISEINIAARQKEVPDVACPKCGGVKSHKIDCEDEISFA